MGVTAPKHGRNQSIRNKRMAEHNLFYYHYASFMNAQLPLLKVAAMWFDKLVILDPVGASSDTIGAERSGHDAVRSLEEDDIPLELEASSSQKQSTEIRSASSPTTPERRER